MPRVKIDYIVSFSSEDPEHRAANLLAGEVSKKKWLCTKGEPSCSVVLQLTQAVEISAIHVGAYHAALVEVLVGLSERPNDPFQVLVPSCVFVPPGQSRRDEGVSRVRSFSGDELAEDARGKRYDRVRIVCSQPYNKHCQYGLSFVHIHEPETRVESASAPTPTPAALPPRLLTLDTFSSDDEDFRPGELFAKHMKSPDNSDSPGSSNTGAQIRQATSNALKNISDSSTKLLKTPISKAGTSRQKSIEEVPAKRQRYDLMYTDDDARPHDKIDRVVNRHKEQKTPQQKGSECSARKRKRDDDGESSKKLDDMESDDESNKSKGKNTQRDKKAAAVNSKKNKDKDNKNVSKTSQGKKKDSSTTQKKVPESNAKKKKRDNEGHSKKPDENKSGNEMGEVCEDASMILRGVTLALSGYVGARRASLRDTALALGARYSPDWTPKCTHLICAFPNTPKLRTARASGAHVVVVTGDWLDSCLSQQRRLPWRWYATDPADRTKVQHDLFVDSDDDDDDDDHDDKYVDDNDDESVDDDGEYNFQCDIADGDTDEEIADSLGFILPPPHYKQRFEELDKLYGYDERLDNSPSPVAERPAPGQAALAAADVKGERRTDSTDEDELTGYGKMVEERIDTNKSLPDFFEGSTFVISDEAGDKSDREVLARYVCAFGGLVIPASEMDENSKVHYMICSEEGALGECARSGAKRVRPSWLWKCACERRLCAVDGNS